MDPSPIQGRYRDILGHVTQQAREDFTSFALSEPASDVRFVVNVGGLTSANFTLRAGEAMRHLKLLPPGEDIAHLQRWRALDPILHVTYHAPRVLGEVTVAGWRGLVLEHVPGASPRSWREAPALHASCLRVLRALHADHDMLQRLRDLMEDRSARQSMLEWFCDTIDADLDEVGGEMPVDAGTLAWMQDEAATLRSIIRDAPCYDDAPVTAIHNDLWEENVIVGPAAWSIIDWDALAPGDPVMDMVIATWGAGGWEAEPEWLRDAAPVIRLRAELCWRAEGLIDIVDSLADVVEMMQAPVDTSAIREGKVHVHRSALAAYRARYRC